MAYAEDDESLVDSEVIFTWSICVFGDYELTFVAVDYLFWHHFIVVGG